MGWATKYLRLDFLMDNGWHGWCMDAWVDGRMEEWMYGWINERTNEWVTAWPNDWVMGDGWSMMDDGRWMRMMMMMDVAVMIIALFFRFDDECLYCWWWWSVMLPRLCTQIVHGKGCVHHMRRLRCSLCDQWCIDNSQNWYKTGGLKIIHVPWYPTTF